MYNLLPFIYLLNRLKERTSLVIDCVALFWSPFRNQSKWPTASISFLNVWWLDFFEVFLFDIQSILFEIDILLASAKLILSNSFCNLVILNFSRNFPWTVFWKNLTQSYLSIYVQRSSKTLFFTFPSTRKKTCFHPAFFFYVLI